MTGLKTGSLGGTRTPDKVVNSHLLYQLSYQGTNVLCCELLNCEWRIYHARERRSREKMLSYS